MRNIILIGNGFDLAHNLPTSYNHFIKKIAKNAFDDPKKNHLLQVIGIVNQKHNEAYSFQNRAYIQKTDLTRFYIKSNNSFLIKICREINTRNWCDIENLYFEELKTRTIDNVKSLNDEFNSIKIELEIYIKSLAQNNTLNSFSDFFKKIPETGDTLCINFNYTNLYSKLYNNDKVKLINIHGELYSSKNPIIFGYAAKENENEELLERGNNEFLKNIKTYHYNRTPIERTLKSYLKADDLLNVYVLGHSCGNSDNNILNRILNYEKMRKIDVFYYENYDNYFDTLINIRRVMATSINYDKVTEFENSYRCPQYFDLEKSPIRNVFLENLNKEISNAKILEKRIRIL